jgi:hypothetical protein
MTAPTLEQELTQFEGLDQQLKSLIAAALHAFGEVWYRARACVPPTAAPWCELVCGAELRILASVAADDQGRSGAPEVSSEVGLRIVWLQLKAAELLAEHFLNRTPSEDLFPLRLAMQTHLRAIQAIQTFVQGERPGGGQ